MFVFVGDLILLVDNCKLFVLIVCGGNELVIIDLNVVDCGKKFVDLNW